MEKFGAEFAALTPGEMMAAAPVWGVRRQLFPWSRRYWELLGCTTREASKSQFEHCTGWWMHYYHHPNFRGIVWNKKRRWDYGYGIKAWELNFSGKVRKIDVGSIRDGHLTRIGKTNYIAHAEKNVFRDLNKGIRMNYSLKECAHKLDIHQLLEF